MNLILGKKTKTVKNLVLRKRDPEQFTRKNYQ